MNYRTVGNRLAVNFEELHLPVSTDTAIALLDAVGFSVIEVDIVAEARKLVGNAEYRRGARLREAPAVFDCSGLMKWLYGLVGVWLPRRSIQQREIGRVISYDKRQPGDIIFCSGHIDYYIDDPQDGVGHVGIITGEDSVVHAANRKLGVVESPLSSFTDEGKLRGIRRYITETTKILVVPTDREIEISDDIRWVVLQNIS